MERDDQLYTDPNMHGYVDQDWSVDIESLSSYPVVGLIANGMLSLYVGGRQLTFFFILFSKSFSNSQNTHTHAHTCTHMHTCTHLHTQHTCARTHTQDDHEP